MSSDTHQQACYTDVVIVGAGISGIAAAVQAVQEGHTVKVLESADQPGGILQTFSTEPLLEMGAHSLFNSYASFLALIREADYETALKSKAKMPFRGYYQGRFPALLPQFRWVSLGVGMLRWYLSSRQGKTLYQHYRSLFGAYNYDQVLRHCFNAVLCQQADSFPAELLFNVKKRNKRFPRQFALHGGMSALIRHLIDYYQLNVHTGCAVTAVRAAAGGVQIESAAGYDYAKNVVLATPSDVSAALVEPVNTGAAAQLGCVRRSTIHSCALRWPAHAGTLPRCAGLIGMEADFYSAVSADPCCSAQTVERALVVHFKPHAGSSGEALLQRACTIAGIDVEQVSHWQVKTQSVPALVPDDLQRVQQAARQLASSHIYLCGNYFARLAVEDCVQRGCKVVKQLSSATGRQDADGG